MRESNDRAADQNDGGNDDSSQDSDEPGDQPAPPNPVLNRSNIYESIVQQLNDAQRERLRRNGEQNDNNDSNEENEEDGPQVRPPDQPRQAYSLIHDQDPQDNQVE